MVYITEIHDFKTRVTFVLSTKLFILLVQFTSLKPFNYHKNQPTNRPLFSVYFCEQILPFLVSEFHILALTWDDVWGYRIIANPTGPSRAMAYAYSPQSVCSYFL